MKKYRYDPILCMNVPDSTSKAKDAAHAEVRDASDRDRRALESIKSIVNNIQRSSDVLHDFIVIKNTANQIQDKTLKAEAMKIVNSMASKIRGAGAHDSLVKAIRTSDRFTVWESDEYDDIYVSYEGGTYVLYVENRPQADGPQQRMIQLAKQEERMRG